MDKTSAVNPPLKVLIVTPALNEQETLPRFIKVFHSHRKIKKTQNIDLRLLIVNDGSTDGTLPLLRKLNAEQPDVISYISFTANFGHQAALLAGLMHSKWPDAVITMDCDLEHPFEVIPQMIAEWRKDEVILVNAIRVESEGLGFHKKLFSNIFYKVARLLTRLDIKPGQADFRLWDASVLHSINHYLPQMGSLRVFAAWIPGKKANIEYKQVAAKNRKSRFGFRKNWDLATISIIRFSGIPLRFGLMLGLSGLLFSLSLLTLALTFEGVRLWLDTSEVYRVWHIVLTIFMNSLDLLCLGIMAVYFRMLVFAKDFPKFIIFEQSPPYIETRGNDSLHRGLSAREHSPAPAAGQSYRSL